MVAEDGFLPRPLAAVGRQLVFSVGILYLAAAADLLLVVFGGFTDRLIPLFAIGAFLTFTMSRLGMVVHWLRARTTFRSVRHRTHLAINALGAATTGIALLIIIAAKFSQGAWITVVVIPAVIVLLKSIKRYYDGLDAALREEGPIKRVRVDPPLVLVESCSATVVQKL
jgi:hypothetical protein